VDGQLAAWETQTLRLTAFPSPSAQIIRPTWWRDLMGNEPESSISQPRKGGLQEEGTYENGKLVLVFEPTRIDWLYTPMDDEKQQAKGFLTISPLHDALSTFIPLMNRWFELETCPSVQRLALGTVVLQPVQDLRTGYQQLMQYLNSVQLDVDNSSDFLFQINRRRDSTVVPGLRINRLSRWSVASMQRQIISMPIASVPTRHEVSPLYFACRLELDINTVPEFQDEFDRGRLPSILRELADLGLEIANRGDIP
jgi:hypothetical protein